MNIISNIPRLFAPLGRCCTHPISRGFTVSTKCHKSNTRRPKAASSVASSDVKKKAFRDSMRQLSASTNRKNWDASNSQLAARMERIPNTNVYYAPNFRPKLLSLNEAVGNIRESAQPAMFDCMENPLRVKFTLNMCTKKKTKFVQKFESHVTLPHLLTFLPKLRVIALCKDPDEAELALQHGAAMAGADELFLRIEHGNFHREEYDIVVAHEQYAPTLGKLRHVLKDRLPTSKNGRLGEDVLQMVKTFTDGVSVESTPFEGVPEVSFLNVIIGQPSWDDNLLQDNLQCYFDLIEEKKSTRIVGQAVSSAELFCPPTGESFLLDCAPFMASAQARKSRTSEVRETDESPDELSEVASN